jgi:hypothetical protein
MGGGDFTLPIEARTIVALIRLAMIHINTQPDCCRSS